MLIFIIGNLNIKSDYKEETKDTCFYTITRKFNTGKIPIKVKSADIQYEHLFLISNTPNFKEFEEIDDPNIIKQLFNLITNSPAPYPSELEEKNILIKVYSFIKEITDQDLLYQGLQIILYLTMADLYEDSTFLNDEVLHFILQNLRKQRRNLNNFIMDANQGLFSVISKYDHPQIFINEREKIKTSLFEEHGLISIKTTCCFIINNLLSDENYGESICHMLIAHDFYESILLNSIQNATETNEVESLLNLLYSFSLVTCTNLPSQIEMFKKSIDLLIQIIPVLLQNRKIILKCLYFYMNYQQLKDYAIEKGLATILSSIITSNSLKYVMKCVNLINSQGLIKPFDEDAIYSIIMNIIPQTINDGKALEQIMIFYSLYIMNEDSNDMSDSMVHKLLMIMENGSIQSKSIIVSVLIDYLENNKSNDDNDLVKSVAEAISDFLICSNESQTLKILQVLKMYFDKDSVNAIGIFNDIALEDSLEELSQSHNEEIKEIANHILSFYN